MSYRDQCDFVGIGTATLIVAVGTIVGACLLVAVFWF